MLRLPLSRMLLLVTFVATLASGPAASGQVSWKLYDLRDLIGLIPPPTTATSESFVDRGQSVHELMGRVCSALGVSHAPLLAGVYGVEADDIQHADVQGLLEQIRSLYAETYEVQLVWFTAEAHKTPAIGDQIAPVEPLHRHRLVVTRRTPSPVTLVTRHSYVYDLSAVVATSAVAYDPDTDSIDGGLQLSLLVGAGQEQGNRTSIRLLGELRRVTMGKMSSPMMTPEVTTPAIELPIVALRSILTNLNIEHGKMTVLTVLDGFEEGECIVIAGSVRKL